MVYSQDTEKYAKMALIQGGSYLPLYSNENNEEVVVADFYMDIHPVTNQEFKAFINQNSEWKKENVIKLFAEKSYLKLLDYSDFNQDNNPVTYVSWFAAKSYCKSLDKRLPTLDEWEYVALSSEELYDARKLPAFNQFLLDWYERPNSVGLAPVKSTFKNKWGVYDMHGLIWEWVMDFNSVLMSGESRKDVDTDRNLFCGSGAIGANDLMNYAAFIRYAFRGSIKANFCIKNLGFRCAKSVNH